MKPSHFGFPFGSEPQGRRLVSGIHSDFGFRISGFRRKMPLGSTSLTTGRGDRYAGISRRGFATITALARLSLVGPPLATLPLTFAAGARRTAKESTDAQLRQLLFAGAA